MHISLPWPLQRLYVEPAAEEYPPASKPTLSSLLIHYETPGIQPPSSRVDPRIRPQEYRPLRVRDLWKYGAFVANKATILTRDVLYHHIWGPRRPSWGVEMTIITSLMRDVGRHSALANVAMIRLAMSLAGFVPLPSDALVTPVTFRVRKRKLRGILAEYDAQETGGRQLSGEWVVGKRLWQRLQAEWKAGRTTEGQQGGETPGSGKRKPQPHTVVLYLHGGAYYVSSAAAQRIISIPLSKYADARVFALDYRLAPETVFPGPLHDCVCAYLRLTEDLHIPPENIVIAGDSAGGGLSLALLMYLRDNDYPLPSGAILMCPWVDLTMSCESIESNAPFDVVPLAAPDDHLNPVSLYLGMGMEQYLTHPYASPLFGDFKGLPPLLIQAGDAEILRDEITLLAHKATLAGVEVKHELYEDAIHVFQAYPFLDASKRAFLSCREFVRTTIPAHQVKVPQSFGDAVESKLDDEIDNDQARIVSGDGVEIAAGREVEEQDRRRESDANSSEDDSSWQKATNASPTPALSSCPSEDEAESSKPHRPRAHTVTSSPPDSTGMRRIKSTLSLFARDTAPRPSLTRTATPVLSRNSSHTDSGQARSSTNAHPRFNTVSMGMSSLTSPPPSPSIRRGLSHPDITSLVEQWNHGPANQTIIYQPKR